MILSIPINRSNNESSFLCATFSGGCEARSFNDSHRWPHSREEIFSRRSKDIMNEQNE